MGVEVENLAITIVDSDSIDFTLSGQQISAVVLPPGVNHNSLMNVHPDVNTDAFPTFAGLTLRRDSYNFATFEIDDEDNLRITDVDSIIINTPLIIDSDDYGLCLGDDQDATLKWDNINTRVNLDKPLTVPNVISNIATGTSPYACISTTLNSNLNADLLDGQHASYFQIAGSYQPLDATLTSLAAVAGVQGDLLYATGTDAWGRLAKSTTASQYLKNSGTSNNPAWTTITQNDIINLKTSSSPTFVDLYVSYPGGIPSVMAPYSSSTGSLLDFGTNFYYRTGFVSIENSVWMRLEGRSGWESGINGLYFYAGSDYGGVYRGSVEVPIYATGFSTITGIVNLYNNQQGLQIEKSTGKLGFYGVTPVVQPTHIVDADITTVVAQFNALLLKLETIGILAAA